MTEILQQQCAFHLRNANISYVMRLVNGETLMHAYFGKRLGEVRGDVLRRFAAVPEEAFDRNEFRLDRLPQEYPASGYGDLRAGALAVRGEDGVDALALRYVRHAVRDGKPALNGLPATHDETGRCKTLCVTLEDRRLALECDLYYTVFDDCDAIARHVVLRNTGRQILSVDRVMSACVDFHSARGQLLTLSGAWARERRMDWRPLAQGRQGVDSVRGASSAQSSPFMLLAEHGAAEDVGEVYAFALAYSGNFTANVTVDQYGGARAMIGLNDAQFDWQLLPGESFTTPEAVLVYAADGLGGMSRAWHTLCHRHVTRGRYAGAQRPILLNNWEATYFDFTEEKLLALAGKAAQIGVELFVLDDGWFGRRDTDTASLGDWVEDPRKLPEGLAGFSERIRALGLRFGLWMEPEMVSPDSDLYRAHPDWCLHAPGMPRLTGRNQLVLDMGRADVQAFVYEAVAGALTRAKADYLKWDMNRNFSPAATAALPPARQRETAHRYMLGLYAVLERLNKAFPDVLFESCASGGGRFDLGMLYYMPQTWCSDNTDAHDRCLIQYGTSLVFPPSAMGAHISAVPNHQTGRVTALETRSAVAMGGTYGFELDLTRMDEAELDRMRALLAQVKSVRDTLLYGQYIRLWNPFEGRGAAWMSVSACGAQAVVTAVRFRAAVNGGPEVLRLRGLESDALYAVRGTDLIVGGDELMNLGLPLHFAAGDDTAFTAVLERVGG
ncbi:MAG: alpha-galactosidase [Clostridiales bacterium]|nr:alpha-galactosidase [Clostridiales bacterium]